MTIVTVQFQDLPSMMRYLKVARPIQWAVIHHEDEFDDEGIYQLSHPMTEQQLSEYDGEGEE